MRKKIICIGQPSLGGDYLKSTIQLMEALSTYQDVLYVEYAFTWLDLIRAFFKKNNVPIARLLRIKPSLQAFSSSFYTYTLPPILPYNWIKNKILLRLVQKLNSSIIGASLRNLQKRLSFHEPIVINALSPTIGLGLWGKLNEKKVIYYCYDEISQAKWLKTHGAAAEQIFISLVDKVIVSSKGLLESKSKLNKNTYLVANGVDLTIFKANTYLPENNKVGYIGTIDDRIDKVLLAKIFERFKHVQFEFIGRIQDKTIIRRFQDYPNVTFFGAVDKSQFSRILSSWTVGLIPFVKNEFTQNIYPLKINEYLCNGLTVLCTNFTHLYDFEEHIELMNHKNFNEKLNAALLPQKAETIKNRKAFAAKNTWESRASELIQILQQS